MPSQVKYISSHPDKWLPDQQHQTKNPTTSLSANSVHRQLTRILTNHSL